jgi:hypothetical protein
MARRIAKSRSALELGRLERQIGRILVSRSGQTDRAQLGQTDRGLRRVASVKHGSRRCVHFCS